MQLDVFLVRVLLGLEFHHFLLCHLAQINILEGKSEWLLSLFFVSIWPFIRVLRRDFEVDLEQRLLFLERLLEKEQMSTHEENARWLVVDGHKAFLGAANRARVRHYYCFAVLEVEFLLRFVPYFCGVSLFQGEVFVHLLGKRVLLGGGTVQLLAQP